MMDSNSTNRMPIRSTTTIQDLNDDVLRETFRRGLCTVADVCSTFKRNAVAEFSTRNKDEYIGLSFGGNGLSKQSLPMLRDFGSVIRFLRVFFNGKVHSAQIVEFIVQYCGKTLKGLFMQNFMFSINLISKLQPLHSQLQEMTNHEGFWESEQTAVDMFSSCREVRTMSFSLDFPLRGNIPKLTSLSMSFFYNVDERSIENFLKENPQLVCYAVR